MKQIEVVIDIETIPNQINNYPEIVSRKLENKHDKNDIKFCAINPLFGQIINISVDINDNQVSFITKNETSLLIDFWTLFSEFTHNEIKLISFNGKRFDIPYILLRSSVLKIRPTIKLLYKRYDTYYHFDCLEILTNFYQDQNFLNLKEYAEIYHIENNDKDNGCDVFNLFKEDKLDDITNHCLEDLNTTKQLYNILKNYI